MFNDMLTLNKNVFYVRCRTIMLTGNNWQSILFCNVLTAYMLDSVMLHIFSHYAHVE